MKTLVLFAHPRPDRSEVNVHLAHAARRIEGVSVVDLYAEYPAFDIDCDREQQRLVDHDAVILQHPLYWYSSPAILKEWQDLVLEHGFAYGHDGHALDGKVVLNAVTCGGAREAYTDAAVNRGEVKELLLPFAKTFDLCRMTYLAPFVLYSAGRAGDEGRVAAHVAGYTALLTALVDDRIDLAAAQTVTTLSENLGAVISEGDS